jgi:TolA-binding protein
MRRQLWIGWSIGAAIVVLTNVGGCAKFNLFYNAETAFSEAEDIGRDIDPRNQPTGAQRTKYQLCIAKCKLLLDEYPNSAYVDDALFYMGKSRYRLRDWGGAVTEFDNLLTNFPNSEFAEEAMYLKSLALISRGDEDGGQEWFARLRESYPDGRYGTEALFRLGDAYAQKERYEDAARYYRKFLDTHPDNEAVPRVVLSLGKALYDDEKYADAAEVLADIDRDKLSQTDVFDAEWMRLASLNRIGRADEAAEEVDQLESVAESKRERARMMLLKGRIDLARGAEDEGIFTLESAAKEFADDPVAVEAGLAIVEYLLQVEGPNGKRFRSQLEAATPPDRDRTPPAVRLRARANQVKRFDRFMQALDEADSNDAADAFRVAESIYVDFDQPERSLEYYRRALEDDPEGPYAPRAAYAIGYIQESELADSTAARATFAQLEENYPDSPQARSLHGEMFLEARAPTVPPEGAETPAPDRGSPSQGAERSSSVRARMLGTWPLRQGGPGATVPRDRIR